MTRRSANLTSRLAREILGWEPKVDLYEGLRRTIESAGRDTLVGAPG